jgi:pimeloyl-ACP methyl ester carboxylesterase
MNPGFLIKGAWCLIPHPTFVKRLMYWVLEDAVKDDAMRLQVDELAKDNYLGMRSFEPKPMVNPTILSDEQLQGLDMPTLFLVGENEKIYSESGATAIERLQTVAPQVETVLIPNAGHGLTLVQADMVNAAILDFVTSAHD